MPFLINQSNLLPERLRALPAFEPPHGGWQRLSQRLAARRRRHWAAATGLAMAASLMAAVGLVKLAPQTAAPAGGSRTPDQVAQLIDRSQRLEHRLAQARPQVAVWDEGRARRAALIETRLRRLDARLSYADEEVSEELWRNRVQLMNALVELHEPQAPALQYASYQY